MKLLNEIPALLAAADASTAARRAPLLKEMEHLAASSIGCASCAGTCCTFVANSVTVTPAEAIDLWLFLRDEGRINEAERERLRANVERFQLARPLPGVGNRQLLRRRYTCPFFVEKNGDSGFACTISRSNKPYGCLGFNAQRQGVTDGEACGANAVVLTARETALAEEETLNARIAAELGLAWRSAPVPVALLAICDAMDRQNQSGT